MVPTGHLTVATTVAPKEATTVALVQIAIVVVTGIVAAAAEAVALAANVAAAVDSTATERRASATIAEAQRLAGMNRHRVARVRNVRPRGRSVG